VKFCVTLRQGIATENTDNLAKRNAWNDQDMSWLKRDHSHRIGSKLLVNDEQQIPYQRAGLIKVKRSWTGVLPWERSYNTRFLKMKPSHGGKRLWEGAEDEVGWIKRGTKEQTAGDEKRDINILRSAVGRRCESILDTEGKNNCLAKLGDASDTKVNTSKYELKYEPIDEEMTDDDEEDLDDVTDVNDQVIRQVRPLHTSVPAGDIKRQWKESDISWL